MRIFVLMLLAGPLMGCAPQTVPLPKESANECERLVAMTERVYCGKSIEEAAAAATRLFELTGGGYVVTRTADGLTARRGWPPVAPGKDVPRDGGDTSPVAPDKDAPQDGSDTWTLTAKEVSECRSGSAAVPGVKLSVYHTPELYAQGLIPTECSALPAFKPVVSRFTTTPAVYDLFFLRMDHLLGKNVPWQSCASHSEYVRNNIHYSDQFSGLNFRGHLDGLCAQAQDDHATAGTHRDTD